MSAGVKQEEAMSEMDLDALEETVGRASRLLSAMANQKRLLILCQLVGRECAVGELAERLGTRQSTVSQHLALLKQDGLVESRREAQSQLYSLSSGEARAVLEALYDLYCRNPS
jgi:DNA-binding transcriptional ArsR family regulator